MYNIKVNDPQNLVMYQYDKGNQIEFDANIEDYTQIHYECGGETATENIIDNKALVPQTMTSIGESIKCFFYVYSEDFGRTKFEFTILINKRPEPNVETEPEEKNTFLLQIAEALNDAKAAAEKAQADVERAKEAATETEKHAEATQKAAEETQKSAEAISEELAGIHYLIIGEAEEVDF